MFGMDVSHSHIIDTCFRFPDFPRIREWRGSKCRFWVRKSAKIGVFRPSNFLGDTMTTYIGDKIFQNTPRRVAKFRENRPRDVEKSVVVGLKKIKTRLKYNILPLSLKRYAGDCNECCYRHCMSHEFRLQQQQQRRFTCAQKLTYS